MIATAGGGGWGDPLQRDPEKVQRDVVDGYVSIEAARDSYGVVLQPETQTLDHPETERLRAQMSGDREHS
jgi:N-methylhydantoinase B/oxoprolinase/acetone carboxylase alpha subunit